MKLNDMIPELTVSDIDKTKDFYINKLGFVLEYERTSNKFIFLSFEKSQFMFEQLHEDGWNVGDMEYPYGRGINFSITCSDVYELYKRVLDNGVKPYRELRQVKYKCGDEEVTEVQFLIQDPDGYLLRFTN